MEIPPQQHAPVPQQQFPIQQQAPLVPPPPPAFFSREQVILIYAALILFGASVVGSMLSTVFKNIGLSQSAVGTLSAMLLYAWFFGVLVGFATAFFGFIIGIIRLGKDKGRLLGSSIIIFLGLMIVGYGTCAFNLTSMNF